MAEVKEQAAGSRPAGGYSTSARTSSAPLVTAGMGTPTSRIGGPPRTRGKRGAGSRTTATQLSGKQRTIISSTTGLLASSEMI